VQLSYRDRQVLGESTGTATQSGVHRAVATAALHAIEQLVGDQARFEVDQVEVSPVGRDRTVLVTVTMVSASGTDRLTGSAVVRGDTARRLRPLRPGQRRGATR